MAFWQIFKLSLLGLLVAASFTAAWTVQGWRYAGKETAYLQQEQKLIAKEAAHEAKAANAFEKKQEKTNAVYKKIIDALKAAKPNSTVCFDAERLRDVNAALTRTSPDTAGAYNTLPRP